MLKSSALISYQLHQWENVARVSAWVRGRNTIKQGQQSVWRENL